MDDVEDGAVLGRLTGSRRYGRDIADETRATYTVPWWPLPPTTKSFEEPDGRVLYYYSEQLKLDIE